MTETIRSSGDQASAHVERRTCVDAVVSARAAAGVAGVAVLA
jgi:hypothetical protein